MNTRFFRPNANLVSIVLLSVILTSFSSKYNNEITEEISERKMMIRLESVLVMSNNHVGHDWKHFLSVKDHVLYKGEEIILSLEKRAPLTIEAHAVEEDKDFPDVGKEDITFIYSDLIAIDKNRFEIDVEVTENGGQYAGNTAVCKFIFLMRQLY